MRGRHWCSSIRIRGETRVHRIRERKAIYALEIIRTILMMKMEGTMMMIIILESVSVAKGLGRL